MEDTSESSVDAGSVAGVTGPDAPDNAQEAVQEAVDTEQELSNEDLLAKAIEVAETEDDGAAEESTEETAPEDPDAGSQEEPDPGSTQAATDTPGSEAEYVAKIAKAEARARTKILTQKQKLREEKARIQPILDAVQRFQTDPDGALADIGRAVGVNLDFPAIVEHYLETGDVEAPAKQEAADNPAVSAIKQEVQELKEQLAQERQAKQISEYSSQIRTHLSDESVKYIPKIAKVYGTDPETLIGTQLSEHYRLGGDFIAPDKVVSILEERFRKQWETIRQEIGVSQPDEVIHKSDPEARPTKAPQKTLTNRAASEVSSRDLSDLTEEELIRRAMAVA